MEQLRKILLKDRYSVLLTTIAAYLLVVVVEGFITGREARVVDFENPYLDLNFQYTEEIESFSDLTDEQ